MKAPLAGRPGRLLGRAVLWALPAGRGYLVALPWAASALDEALGLPALPSWSAWLALGLLPLGMGVALWSLWLLAVDGRGTPNPLAPPTRLVLRGPYRCSRNPMMVGAWLAGFGLAFALRSVSLLGAVTAIIAVGIAYVRLVEEPGLRDRFGASYARSVAGVPRWLGVPHRRPQR